MTRFPLGIPQNGWFIFGKSQDFRDLWMFDDVWGLWKILFNLVHRSLFLGLVHPWHLRLTPNFSELLAHLFHSLLQGSSIVLGRRLILNTKTGSFLNIQTNKNTGKEPLYTEIYRKNGQRFTRTTLCGHLPNLGPHFIQACAVEMHFNISQEPLHTDMYRKNAGAQNEHPDRPLHLP